MSALVKMNDNIVAKLGAIIPEPFAIPQILINSSPTIISSYASFGFVSVVMMADAIFIQYILLCSVLNLSTKSGRRSLICSTGNSSPITPVACLERIRPEIAACNAGTLNYLKTRKNGAWAYGRWSRLDAGGNAYACANG